MVFREKINKKVIHTEQINFHLKSLDIKDDYEADNEKYSEQLINRTRKRRAATDNVPNLVFIDFSVPFFLLIISTDYLESLDVVINLLFFIFFFCVDLKCT